MKKESATVVSGTCHLAVVLPASEYQVARGSTPHFFARTAEDLFHQLLLLDFPQNA
jgi:hypothetical protein